MIIVGVVLAVLLVGAAVAWAVARRDVPGVPAAVGTRSAHPLPDGPLTPADVHAVRFDQTVRGYDMDQVDRALDRFSAELAARDAQIAQPGGEGR